MNWNAPPTHRHLTIESPDGPADQTAARIQTACYVAGIQGANHCTVLLTDQGLKVDMAQDNNGHWHKLKFHFDHPPLKPQRIRKPATNRRPRKWHQPA